MLRRTHLLFVVLVCGPASGQNRQEMPSAAPAKVESPRVPGLAEIPTAGVDSRAYIIGPEDVLFVRVWREQDFSAPHVVRPDGKITIPLVGDVQAAGITPERLGEQLEQALGDYINKPDVTVTVSQVNSKKYFITGQVFRPGEFSMATPVRVFDALSNAGGFRDFANKKKILIIRGNERLRFNYNDILKGKNLEQNVYLQHGDTIVVP